MTGKLLRFADQLKLPDACCHIRRGLVTQPQKVKGACLSCLDRGAIAGTVRRGPIVVAITLGWALPAFADAPGAPAPETPWIDLHPANVLTNVAEQPEHETHKLASAATARRPLHRHGRVDVLRLVQQAQAAVGVQVRRRRLARPQHVRGRRRQVRPRVGDVLARPARHRDAETVGRLRPHDVGARRCRAVRGPVRGRRGQGRLLLRVSSATSRATASVRRSRSR